MGNMEKPNIILIVMDCARADHMSCYGYFRQTTPHLDQLASKGVLYENAISSDTWSIPAHWSLFTGLYLERHGVWNRNLALSPQCPTIAELLRIQGYETVAFSNNPHVGVKNGFGRGFDTFQELFRIRERRKLPDLARRALYKALFTVLRFKYDGAYRTNQAIKKWLTSRPYPERPFFLFVNYMEPHEPYQPPRPFRSRFMDERVKTASRSAMADYIKSGGGRRRDCRLSEWEIEVDVALYDAELAFLDAQLHSLFRHMGRQGLLDNSLLIVTSDHGHSLGEHEVIGHSPGWLYDTQVRVPFILYAPGILPASTRVSQQVQLVDVAPSVLAVLDNEQSESDKAYLQGRSLLPEDLEGADRSFTVIQAHYWEKGHREYKLNAVRTDDYKYIWDQNGHEELYHIRHDPTESHNLIDQELVKASDLRACLRDWLASNGPFKEESRDYRAQEIELDEEVVDRLRALGYIE